MDALKSFLQVQLDEIRENKLRFGLIVASLIGVIIFAAFDNESYEEIKLDAPKESVNVEQTATKISVASENVKTLIGANVEEVFIQDPFQAFAQIEKVEPPEVEEKSLPPIEPIQPVIFEPPKVEELVKPPEEKFVLQGTAIGEENTALVKKIVGDKVETFFVKVGDKVKGKSVVEIGQNFLALEGGEKIFIGE